MARIKLNPRLLPVMLVLLVALQILVPYQGWIFILVPFGGAWLIGWAWVRALARSLTLTRELRFGWAQVGDALEERLTLANTSLFPALWVEISDASTLPGYSANCATGVGGDTENSWMTRGECTRRGIFTLGPTRLRTGDPFGFYSLAIDYHATTNMIVMPPIVPLPDIQVAPGGRAGEGRRRAQSFEQTVNASNVRDYQPHDSVSRIHWHTSAHRDALFVRQFDNTPSADWWIILDLDASAQVGAGEDSTLEHAVILAASLADRGLRLGRAVGLAAAGDTVSWLSPRGGPAQRWEILRALALVSPGKHSLAHLLSQSQTAFQQAASLILITPAVSGEWIPHLLPLTWRGAMPTVMLLDPLSFGGVTSARGAAATLADLEIAHYTITRDLLDRPERHPGREGHWEWKVTPTGRARPLHPERETRWRPLK